MERDLYRIDDLLLRSGACLAALVVTGLMAFPWSEELGSPIGAAVVALGVLAALGLLAAGLVMRRREQRIVAIWELLRQQAELHVPPLLENSDFERTDLEHAVRFLNNRGLDHYVWDRHGDTIRDANLERKHLHVEVCDACGVKIALDVPLAYSKLPTCTHCGDPVSAESLQDRKREAIDALRAEHRFGDASQRCPKPDISIPLFLLLLCIFWPAAIFYAWHKWQGEP